MIIFPIGKVSIRVSSTILVASRVCACAVEKVGDHFWMLALSLYGWPSVQLNCNLHVREIICFGVVHILPAEIRMLVYKSCNNFCVVQIWPGRN